MKHIKKRLLGVVIEMSGFTEFFTVVTNQIIVLKGVLQGYSASLLSFISRMGSVSAASYDYIKFILQFIPPPLLVVFAIELVFGLVKWFLSTVNYFKVVIKWW